MNEKKNIHWLDCLECRIYGWAASRSVVQPDKIHCRTGKVITVFVCFKVGKPPINIVFFIYRVFNNGTYPIVFSINSYVSVYSAMHLHCTVVHSVHGWPPPCLKSRGFVKLFKRQNKTRDCAKNKDLICVCEWQNLLRSNIAFNIIFLLNSNFFIVFNSIAKSVWWMFQNPFSSVLNINVVK